MEPITVEVDPMATDDRNQNQQQAEYETEVDIALEVLFVLGTSLLLPWLYLVLERTNLADLEFEGFNRSRALWVVPLYYVAIAAGTLLLFPAHLELFWTFPLLMLAQLIEYGVHEAGYLLGIGFPITERVSPMRVGGVLAVFIASGGAGWWLRKWDITRECRKILANGQYVLPLRSVEEAGSRLARSKFVALETNLSVLVLGRTGSGKTSAILLAAYQMLQRLKTAPDRSNPAIVLDYKEDYREFLERHWEPEQLVYFTPNGASVFWNVFVELEQGVSADELARGLFPKPPDDADAGQFFATAARQLFGAILTHLDQEFRAEGERATNADLVELVRSTDREGMYDLLLNSEHVTLDLAAARTALDPEADRQAAGVYAQFQQVLADRFRDDFAAAGDFSLTEFMRDPQGRVLVLDVPAMEPETAEPTFRFVIDWAARCALADDQDVTFVLDEFAQLPRLRRIDTVLNLGRGRDSQVLLGVQSIADFNRTYGEDAAEALLAGLVQSIVLRTRDQAGYDYVRSLVGRAQHEKTAPVHDKRGQVVGSREGHDEQYPIAENDLAELEDGEAFVFVPDGWVHGKLYQLAAIRDTLDRALTRIR